MLEDYHLLNKAPFASRLVKSLIQGNEFKFDNESKKLVKTGQSASPGIGSEFAERVADEINVEDWVSGQPAFVLVSVIEVLQLEKSPKAEKLKKAIKKLSLSSDDKGAKLLKILFRTCILNVYIISSASNSSSSLYSSSLNSSALWSSKLLTAHSSVFEFGFD